MRLRQLRRLLGIERGTPGLHLVSLWLLTPPTQDQELPVTEAEPEVRRERLRRQ